MKALPVALALAAISLARPVAAAWHPWQARFAVGERESLTAQGTGLTIDGWAYRVSRADGSPGLASGRPAKVSEHRVPGGRLYLVEYAATGPLAERARISARYLLTDTHLRVDYTVHMAQDWGEINGWGAGLYFALPKGWTAVTAAPVSRWVDNSPDAPYELLGRQCGEVHYGGTKIVLALAEYYPDWAYGKRQDPGFVRFAPTSQAPTARLTLDLFAVSAEVQPYRLAAAAEGFPAALQIETGRAGNVFAPGEPLAFRLRAANSGSQPTHAALRWQVRDYDGQLVAHDSATVQLAGLQEQVVPVRVPSPGRGLYFLEAQAEAGGVRTVRYTTAAVLPARSQPPAASPFGIASYIASPDRYPDQPARETVLGLLQRIGVHWVRSGAPEDAAQVRALAESYRRHGLRWHAQLGHELVTTAEQQPAYLAWLDRMLPLVTPYSQHIEIGNEYNFWGGHLSGKAAEPYTRLMLRPFHDKLRAMAPQAKVLNAGVGGVERPFLDGIATAGGWGKFDVLSVHTGFHPRAPDHPEPDDWWDLPTQLETAQSLLREHGAKPLWVTETYAPTPPRRDRVGERVGADYLVRAYAVNLAAGAEVVEWYSFQDGMWFARSWKPEDDEYYFGLVRPDLSPKPAFVAYATMTERLAGKTYRRRLEAGDPDVYLLEFAGPGGSAVVAWSRRERDPLDFSWWPGTGPRPWRPPQQPWQPVWRDRTTITLEGQPSPLAITDVMGRTKRITAERGTLSLQLTGSPVFVEGLATGVKARAGRVVRDSVQADKPSLRPSPGGRGFSVDTHPRVVGE